MITQPTALVLGAGASRPYGLPVASELRKRILTPNQEVDSFAFQTHRPEESAAWFRQEFRRSQAASIDEFLANADHDLLNAGKRLIAAHIARREDERELFLDTDDRDPSDRRGGDWMKILFNIMGRDATAETFPNNRLTVITFNYDRSFEFKLFWRLRCQYRIDPAPAAKMVNAWPIYHVHGRLGGCCFPEVSGQTGRPYEAALTFLYDPAKDLRLAHEELEASDVLAKAREALFRAARVIFLGFSFHELNCQRLFIGERNRGGRWRSSCLGMTTAECRAAANLARKATPDLCRNRGEEQAAVLFSHTDADAHQFLRENLDFLIDEPRPPEHAAATPAASAVAR